MLYTGFLWGILFYSVAFIVSLWLYHLYSFLYKRIILVILLCCFGHFLATYLYSLFQSDSSVLFFPHATPIFTGVGTGFAINMVWYVRKIITGDSLLATFYFFSAFAFLGSVLWYLLFLGLSQLLNIENQKKIFPALVIMCWPSFLLFTSGMGKDSLSYFLIPLIFLSWDRFFYQRKDIVMMLIILLLSVILMTLIRPYLLIIFVMAYYFSIFNEIRRLSFLRIMIVVILFLCVLYVAKWLMIVELGESWGHLLTIFQQIMERQQEVNTGTSFPILSTNPYVSLLLLPYGFIMNLIMPLFIFARNATGIMASIENTFLVWLLYCFWKQRKIFKIIKLRQSAVRMLFSFFLIGMAFLGLTCTNLGLATRQKSMYLPAFLVVAMLVWLYKKQMKTE